MNLRSYIGDFIGVVILIFIGVIYRYIKTLPEALHQKSIKSFEFQLNSKLEEFKVALAKEIELLKISQAGLQVHKTEEFVRIVEHFNEGMNDPKKFAERMRNPEEIKKFNKDMTDIGIKLFFFAGDSTVKKYVEFRRYMLLPQKPVDINITIKFFSLYAELIIMMRKELGYENTECTIDDFLTIILRDWDQGKLKL